MGDEYIPKYKVGDRVKYQIYATSNISGEGTIHEVPDAKAFEHPINHYRIRYRVRHDGGTETRYVEVGVMEEEIIECVSTLST